MRRVAQSLKTKILAVVIVIVIVVAGVGVGVYIHNKDNGHVQTVTNAQHQLTQISYSGKNGVNAYALLEKHATVKAKKYSFGYFVTSINGTAGNGPKYWTLYVNGKESNVGASSYMTKNSDTITWKLQ
jgi:hypothetical protein